MLFLGLSVLAIWQAFLKRYDYGLYKVLTLFWPVMVVAIFVGLNCLLNIVAWFGSWRVSDCGLIAGAFLDELDSSQNAP